MKTRGMQSEVRSARGIRNHSLPAETEASSALAHLLRLTLCFRRSHILCCLYSFPAGLRSISEFTCCTSFWTHVFKTDFCCVACPISPLRAHLTMLSFKPK